MPRVKRRMFKLLAVISLLLCGVSLVLWPMSHINPAFSRHWVYYCLSGGGPKLVDGDLEFGYVWPEQPWTPSKPGSSTSWSLGDRPMQSLAIDDNYARSTVWRLAGIEARVGRVIPPWG